jgi:hypothetical protein
VDARRPILEARAGSTAQPRAGHVCPRGRFVLRTWSNYRLAHAWVNGVKSAIPDVLDPFEIGEGWFAIEFGTFETIIGDEAPAEQRDAIQHTITALKLDSRELAITRRRAAERYWAPPRGQRDRLPLWSLEQDEPFLASELRRQGRLNPEDA